MAWLGLLLSRVLIAALVIAAVAQVWLLRQAEFAAQGLVSQWQGYGELRYESLWVNLWGSGSLRSVSFAPNGLTQAMLGTPLGYRMTVREVDFSRPEFARDGSLSRAQLTLSGLSLPVDDGYRLRGNDVPPAPAALGYKSFDFDAAVDLRVIADTDLVLVDVNAAGKDVADLRLRLKLETDLDRLRLAPDQVELRRASLDYRDRGLMPRYLKYAAAQAHMAVEQAPQALIAALDRRAAREHWKWNAASAQALRGFILDPAYCRAMLDPPGDLALRDVQRYSVADWPPLLGFALSIRRPLGWAPAP